MASPAVLIFLALGLIYHEAVLHCHWFGGGGLVLSCLIPILLHRVVVRTLMKCAPRSLTMYQAHHFWQIYLTGPQHIYYFQWYVPPQDNVMKGKCRLANTCIREWTYNIYCKMIKRNPMNDISPIGAFPTSCTDTPNMHSYNLLVL